MSHPHDDPSHSHHHHHHAAAGGRLLGALIITLLFAAVEVVGGLISGSLTLLGDAGHMVTDAVALGLAAAAARLAQRPPSAYHSYGLGRAEVVAALTNAVFMLAVVASIAMEAVARITAPVPVAGGTVMAVAAAGLVVNILVAWWLAHGAGTLNERGALLHVLGDLLGSVAALLSGAVIWLTGWELVDPLLALGVVVLILFSTVQLVRESLHVVMEGVPPHLKLEEIGQAMAGIGQVQSVHDLHIWTLSSGSIALTAHIVVARIEQWLEVQPLLHHLLAEHFHIDHITLQPEATTRTVPFPPAEKRREEETTDG